MTDLSAGYGNRQDDPAYPAEPGYAPEPEYRDPGVAYDPDAVGERAPADTDTGTGTDIPDSRPVGQGAYPELAEDPASDRAVDPDATSTGDSVVTSSGDAADTSPGDSAATSSGDEPELVEDADALMARWQQVQTGFVDDPREALRTADELVQQVMKQVQERFATERSGMEQQWSRGEDVSTEDMRLVLQSYRSFFNRLLTV
jgi:hypothetical protein